MTPAEWLVPPVAGVMSIVHPCVWPLVPGYLSFLTTTADDDGHTSQRHSAVLHAGWFVAGCALALMALGAGAALLGQALQHRQVVVERVGGVLLIVFGVAFTGRVPIPWLSADHRIGERSVPGRWRSALVGVAFGLSWSACVGPLLAGVLTMTVVRSERVIDGIVAMLLFAVGQGLPFVALAVAAERVAPLLRQYRRYTTAASALGAATLILLGVLLLSGQFSEVN